MDQGPLIHIKVVDYTNPVREVWTRIGVVHPRGPCRTPRRGGFDPPDPPQGPWRAPGVRGAKLAPPGDGGHLTDFVAN